MQGKNPRSKSTAAPKNRRENAPGAKRTGRRGGDGNAGLGAERGHAGGPRGGTEKTAESFDRNGTARAPSSASPAPAAPAADAAPLRLNKALAAAGVCSRRKADELIAAGRVLVNDAPAGLGALVDPTRDAVSVDGRAVDLRRATAPDREHLYLLLHKPVQTVTTAHDPQGRRTVLDLLPGALAAERPVPAGRLDFFSEGALLLTTDGEVVNRLTHPRHHLPKTYQVLVRFSAASASRAAQAALEAALAAMRAGMRLAEGERLAPVEARVSAAPRPAGDALGQWEARIELVLRQGVNRQVRRMCRDTGLTVLTLVRTAQGPLVLGDLAPGRWRRLTPDEVRNLKEALRIKP
jgi:23S rRNA pseudouridine2605 synthase